ncbi:MAG: flagellar biosynthesis protein FlhB [Chakrabartia godavariana]
MADVDRDQKTEEATAKRKRESAEKGDVLASRELATALAMAFGTGWIALAGGWAVSTWGRMLKAGLSLEPGVTRDFDVGHKVTEMIGLAALPLLGLFGAMLLAALAGPALLGSLGFRAGAMAPKASKLSPAAGLRRMFGTQGAAELGKSIVKVAFLGGVGWWSLSGDIDRLNGLAANDAHAAASTLGSMLVHLLLSLTIALAAIAAIDVPIQIRQRNARLRMSKQEVRDEHKETDGRPEVKAAIRQRQHALLSGSARKAVTEAAVILTNPTHFSVALRYRPGIDAAPFVVARGRGETALAIRELAKEADVPMLEYPQLTRAIYFTTRAGQPVSHDLYVAVATVLAFVFNLEAALATGAQQPDIDVPDNLRFDASGRPET